MRYTPEQWMKQRPDKTHLGFYITFRDGGLTDGLCDALVKMYDNNSKLHVTRSQANFRFDQINLTDSIKLGSPFDVLHRQVVDYTVKNVSQYWKDVDAFDVETRVPRKFGYEHFRINRTQTNGKDGFGDHTDVGDYASARRFVTVLYYLDNIEEGGDAAFPMLDVSYKPVKGSVLIFPSTWQYLHCGLKPISNPKYIMTTFCHYL